MIFFIFRCSICGSNKLVRLPEVSRAEGGKFIGTLRRPCRKCFVRGFAADEDETSEFVDTGERITSGGKEIEVLAPKCLN